MRLSRRQQSWARSCVVDDFVVIGSGGLTARINPMGAELWSLTDGDGRELMTDADPRWWAGHAPLLFPIVGALQGGEYRLDGKGYALGQHGFSRHCRFDVVEHGASHALFRLTDTPESRALYPFAFVLDMAFRVEGAALHMTATVINSGDDPLPASFGYHPAFAWPLPYGAAKLDHRIRFDRDEPAPIRIIAPGGVIAPDPVPSPVKGRALALDDSLFEKDALIWDRLNSRSLIYGPDHGPILQIDFPDTEWLGIWTKPGAHYLCIEPWAGMADPQGYDGDFRDKPGIFTLSPGEQRSFRMDVTLVRE